MEPVVIIPVDHSVAQDVRENDYYSINVKHAKTADEVTNLPELKSTDTSNDVVAFSLGNVNYNKRITDVQSANVALRDKKGRDLTTLANSIEYRELVENYLADKMLVQSVNGKTGNVIINKKSINLENVDDTSDLDKPVSNATQAELDRKQNILSAGANIRLENDVISAIVDFSPIENKIKNVSDEVESVETELENAIADLTVTDSDLQNQLDSHSIRLTNTESATTTNTNSINSLTTRVEGLESSVDGIDLTDYSTHDEVDAKIAEAMAGEQAQDEDLANRITEVRESLNSEVSTRESQITSLQADVANSITNLKREIDTNLSNYYNKSEVDDKIDSILIPDVSEFITRDEADALYAKLADVNAKIAELTTLINNNIGLVNSSNPNQDLRIWLES